MEYEKFKVIIDSLDKIRDRSHSLFKLGVNLMEYEDMYHIVISNLLLSVFDSEGKDWIDWYLYERVGFTEKVNLATDENGKEICYDIPSLWDVVKDHLR